MKATQCVVCEKVKGKRICQLHARAFICPRCGAYGAKPSVGQGCGFAFVTKA